MSIITLVFLFSSGVIKRVSMVTALTILMTLGEMCVRRISINILPTSVLR